MHAVFTSSYLTSILATTSQELISANIASTCVLHPHHLPESSALLSFILPSEMCLRASRETHSHHPRISTWAFHTVVPLKPSNPPVDTCLSLVTLCDFISFSLCPVLFKPTKIWTKGQGSLIGFGTPLVSSQHVSGSPFYRARAIPPW